MRVVEAGQLDGEFEGFEDRDRVFTFLSTGTKWRQDEYRYYYRYAYMPVVVALKREPHRVRVHDQHGAWCAHQRRSSAWAGRIPFRRANRQTHCSAHIVLGCDLTKSFSQPTTHRHSRVTSSSSMPALVHAVGLLQAIISLQ